MEIRSTLNRYLLAHHTTVPSFVRNKLVKLVVDIGRLDWPHFYPDFFSSILQVGNIVLSKIGLLEEFEQEGISVECQPPAFQQSVLDSECRAMNDIKAWYLDTRGFILKKIQWHIHAGLWSLVNCWREALTRHYIRCS